MSKYQEALQIFNDYSHMNQFNLENLQWADETLQELVNKETPKKPIVDGEVISEKDTYCPTCKINVSLSPSSKPPYCWVCGQAIDWSNQ